MTDDQTTPHPPATAEFGHVEVGGPAHAYPERGGVRVTKLAVGSYDNNVYVVASDGEAILVDGAAEPERILAAIEGLSVQAVVETHGHFDHVQALPALVEALGVPVRAHPADRMPVRAEPVSDGERLTVGSVTLEAMHTPGHTPGSVCYLLRTPDGSPPHLFTGDTLFPGGPGNTRGDAEDFATILASLDRLFELPDETRVSPGHGLDTTIGRERPYLPVWRERGW